MSAAPSGLGYDHQFYADLEETALPSARHIVPMLRGWLTIDSVVDAGCGDGSWLSVFKEAGASRVLGLDGPWVDEAQLKIPADCFRRRRIDEALAVEDGPFDLAMTLEVAEHLPPARAPGFVAELCALAPVVLFSAAIPDQGGEHHVNEQWPRYWADLFADRGFRAIDAIRPAVWEAPDVCWWYKQNCLLFASDRALADNPELARLAEATPATLPSLVHPELYAQAVRHAAPSFGRWLKQGGKAWARSRAKRRAKRAGGGP